MFYWSICWAGISATTLKFSPLTDFDIRINPAIRHKFCGKDLTFPFTGEEIRREKLFGEVAERILEYLTPDTLVVGHAFDNDARMLIDACAKYEVKCPEFDYVDTNCLYNALTGESGERSLCKLADLYNFEFNAHDPLEDAKATMAVAKNVTKGDLLGFIKKHKIEPSRVQNSLIYRGGLAPKDKEAKEKLYRSNLPFMIGCDIIAPTELYHFESHMAAKQDLTKLLQVLKSKNHGFTATQYAANVHVTNNLCLKEQQGVLQLRELVCELNLESEKFDFSPKRIRDEKNKAISSEEYYKTAFAKYKLKDGALKGRRVSFTKTVEKSVHFENMLIAILQAGGNFSFDVEHSDIFIVLDKAELKQRGDARLRVYRRKKEHQVLDLQELSALLS